MKAVFFCHAFTSCWNNGNAHFLRGVTRELTRLGHQVVVCEPGQGWSRSNALRDRGEASLHEAESLVPGIQVHRYDAWPDLDYVLQPADLVLVHEWNPPALVAALGRRRAAGGKFTLLFHDTHHRAVTAPGEMAGFDLDGYDGVLAFGEVLREIYVKRGWARRAFTWHEAADIELYRPMRNVEKQCDVIWIGNWGDDERSAELVEFLINPVSQLNLTGRVYGVRYPQQALDAIKAGGLSYGGWLPNHRAPLAFAQARATVHVPRGPYARQLPGIPTIRIFEALACGVPLISAPWSDDEHLFPSGCYLSASGGDAMKSALATVLRDGELAMHLSRAGLRAVLGRHTCRHRAQELLAIIDGLGRFAQEAEIDAPQQRIAS
ncbi:MAG TPA: glycosyltransferase [Bradyrhizobium sp.]|uniref:CgeB family protein n=1 Tax=Bradyrhizobium sp. TaxID=376 RepID=UPI002B4691DE|nr:glycosyltransferase [Bradyrhizobium sp.]HKO71694.1 glycosyltransferase [Bradyrhizobium sp.]